MQESCLYEWHNLIVETSRSGLVGEGEFQWDSYKILDEQLEQQWLESINALHCLDQKVAREPLNLRSREERLRKPLLQNGKILNIMKGFAMGWQNTMVHLLEPVESYGGKVITSSPGRMRLTKNDSDDKEIASTTVVNSKVQKLKVAKRNKPQYNDPLVGSKLAMIKNIRAAAEKKEVEAVEGSGLPIAQAENATDSLELAAMTSPKAHLSLIEARRLVAEAIQFLESCDNQDVSPSADNSRTDGFSRFPVNNRDQKPVAVTDKDFDFGNFSLHNALKGGDAFLPACSKPTVLKSTRLDGNLGLMKYDNQAMVSTNSNEE